MFNNSDYKFWNPGLYQGSDVATASDRQMETKEAGAWFLIVFGTSRCENWGAMTVFLPSNGVSMKLSTQKESRMVHNLRVYFDLKLLRNTWLSSALFCYIERFRYRIIQPICVKWRIDLLSFCLIWLEIVRDWQVLGRRHPLYVLLCVRLSVGLVFGFFGTPSLKK